MMALLVIASGVLGAVALCFLYWMLLRSMYTERINTEEVYWFNTPDLWKIRVCRYRKGRSSGEPVLLCHGAGSNMHNFRYPEGESLIDYLVECGYDCWAVDMRGCRSSKPPFGRRHSDARVDDYLLKDLPTVIDEVLRISGHTKIHWIGHSLGGFLLYAYALEYGTEQIASGITLGAPIGFEGTRIWAPDFLTRFLARHPGFVSRLIRAYAPLGKALHLPLGLFPVNLRNVHPKVTAEHFFNMLDNILPDIFGTLAVWARRKTLTLKRGELDVKEGLKTLRFPLLAFFAPKDPFVSVEYAWGFIQQLPHEDKEMIVLSKENGCEYDYNHVEMPFSRNARREVFAHIGRWLAVHPLRKREDRAREREGNTVTLAAPPLRQAERLDILSGSSFERLRREAEARAAEAGEAQQSSDDVAP